MSRIDVLNTMINAMESGRFNGKLCASEQARLINKWKKELHKAHVSNLIARDDPSVLFDNASQCVIV